MTTCINMAPHLSVRVITLHIARPVIHEFVVHVGVCSALEILVDNRNTISAAVTSVFFPSSTLEVKIKKLHGREDHCSVLHK